ncbi:hypothetical protein WK65_04370 [Burkholderia ubonensis]|uniref:hypothetical protein n=1 Tax=Burkholderia ubonensis TaxID=101571 RepID=UPI00075A9CDA|nr:hypothetical protein [Burkholderia ubonensis]KVU30538.1 hypothetical protein WK65_04370 [Burkholderia ubonensis]
MATPKWTHWASRNMQFWTPEQAISLSLGIDPDQPFPEHLRTSYAERLRELQGAIEAKDELLTVRNGKVERFDFVFWASQREEWNMPGELLSIAVDEPNPEHGEARLARHAALQNRGRGRDMVEAGFFVNAPDAATRVDTRENRWRSFSLEDGDAPAIACEKYIEALVRAKYLDGPDLSPEENDAIREAGAEVLRQSVEAAARQGTLQPRGRDMLPMPSGIPRREQFEPFSELYFERGSFLAFAKDAWLVGEADNAPPEVSLQPTSQTITVEDLAWMIAVQRADQATNHAHGLDERDGLRRTIEIALQVRGWSPDGIPGVIPQIAELARAKQITLHGPIDTEAPEVPDISACPAAWWLTTEDAQRVLTALCQSVRRYTITDAADIIAKRVHPKDLEAERALRSSLVERMEYAVEQGELIANERRKDGEILLNEYAVDEWCAREQFPFRLSLTAQANAEEAAMASAGRRTIEAAAVELATNTGIDAARWESTLVDAITSSMLPLRNPRNLADALPYSVPKNLRTFYDRVDVKDVNSWLDAHPKYGVKYRFAVEVPPAPVEPAPPPPTVAVRTMIRQGAKWTDAELRTLLEEIKQPGATQQQLAEKYSVKRQRISTLLKQARDKFETPARASAFPVVSTGTRKIRGKNY